MYWGVPDFISRYFNHFEWHGNRSEKVIHITFDDGPTDGVTQKVLDILDKYNVKATFFCLGRNVDRHGELYKEILNRGHRTGNHTYSHLKGWRTSIKQYIQDVELAEKYIESDLFRPPYGRIKRLQAKYLSGKYKLVMWDVLTHDYNKNILPEISLKNAIKSTKNGSIIVFHDSVKAADTMFEILPKFIEYFMEKGFTFKKID